MSLDIEIDYYSERAEWGRTEFSIFFLKHETDPLAQHSTKEFSQGSYGDKMEGFEVKVIGMPK